MKRYTDLAAKRCWIGGCDTVRQDQIVACLKEIGFSQPVSDQAEAVLQTGSSRDLIRQAEKKAGR